MTTASLIGKQAQTVADIKAGFAQDQTYINNTIYLLGEMGVGKTYMSAYLATEYADKPSLFVVPSNVTTKFENVLAGFGVSSMTITSYAQAKAFDMSQLTDRAVILPHRFFKRFIEENDMTLFGYVVIDEVHTFEKSARETLLDVLYQSHKATKMLLMTGTLFDASRQELTTMLYSSHTKLFRHYDMHDNAYYELNQLFAQVLQYVSVSLNMADMNQDKPDEQVFTVHPIDFIPMTEEEALNYRLTRTLSHRDGVTASNIIDNPMRSPWRTGRTRGTRLNFGRRYQFRESAMLSALPVEQTAKYQVFTDILNNNDKSKVLVYVSDQELIDTLVELNANTYRVDQLPADLDEASYEAYFKQSFTEKGTQLFFVDPTRIATGIDIPADAIIWYQMINNTSDTIQAQRRVRRMDSVDDVDVWYLAYDNTEQESLVRELSEASKANSASYAVQQTDAIAKVTGVLLDGMI